MTHVPAGALADQARKHLGEDGPLNTCLSNGPERWAAELGLLPLGTGSVTEARRLARAGHHGWSYHEGTAGLARGHVADWDPKYLGSPDDRHVCVVDEVDGSSWRGIGSGTPSGTVARQPASGGMNPTAVLVGYFVAPTETPAPAAPKPNPKPKTGAVKVQTGAVKTAAKPTTYTVQTGDYLARIARQHGTSVRALLAANPALPSRRSADFHIVRADYIQAGQRIRLP